MRRLIVALCALGMSASSLAAQTPQPTTDDSGKSRFALGWNAYATPQLWPDIGDEADPKFGIGLGGMIGLAWIWGDLAIVVGPHVSYQLWTANYANKPSSATQSVTIGMADAGIEVAGRFDESMGFWAGSGSSTMDASMLLKSGETVTYSGLDGEQFSYMSFGLSFRAGTRFRWGFGVTQYEKAARDANRIELRFGLGY